MLGKSTQSQGEVESVDLNPLDVISFPPGAIRRFENIQPAESGEDAIFMFVIGGNAPKAEFTDKAMKELEELGVWPRSDAMRHWGLPRGSEFLHCLMTMESGLKR